MQRSACCILTWCAPCTPGCIQPPLTAVCIGCPFRYLVSFTLAPGSRLPASWARLKRLQVLSLGVRIGTTLPGQEWAWEGSFPSLQTM